MLAQRSVGVRDQFVEHHQHVGEHRRHARRVREVAIVFKFDRQPRVVFTHADRKIEFGERNIDVDVADLHTTCRRRHRHDGIVRQQNVEEWRP